MHTTLDDQVAEAVATWAFYERVREAAIAAHSARTSRNHPSNPNWTPTPNTDNTPTPLYSARDRAYGVTYSFHG